MGLTYSDMVIFLSARQYIHLYFMSSYILWNTIRASLYRGCSPFAGLGIVVNLVSRRSNCSQTATYINTVTTLYIYRCTELSKPPAALTYHPIKRILTLLFLASTKDVYTDRNSKEYIATRKIKTISGMLFSNYGNTVKNIWYT